MATLTRTRATFQVDDAEAQARRPLHLDIPTPFPRLPRDQEETGNTPVDVENTIDSAEATASSTGDVNAAEHQVGGESGTSQSKEVTDSVSAPIHHICTSRCMS